MPTQIPTKRELSIDSKGLLVQSVTEEIVGASSLWQLTIPAGARNVRRSISDGKATLTYDIGGGGEGGGGATNSIAISATASQEPLATHPYFQPGGKWAVSEDEWKQWGEWDKSSVPNPLPGGLSAGFQKFIKLTQQGFTDYLQPRIVIRNTTTQNGFPSLSKLGKIDGPANAPALPDNGNWLLTGVEGQQEQGGAWTITREHTSSGAKGWNEDIYN